MKKLDEAKKYYLGNLNKDQRGVLYDYLLSVDEAYSGLSRDEFKEFSKDYIVFDCNHWDWLAEDRTDALELFEDEIKQLKKEDVFLDLAKLTREQLSNVEKVLKINKELVYKTDRKLSKKGFDEINKYPCLAFDDDDNEWMCFSRNPFGSIFNNRGNKTEISYNEFINLFQDKEEIKLNLQIGDTFEYEGFICEVKEKIEEKKWYKVTNRCFEMFLCRKLNKEEFKLFNEDTYTELTEITDTNFINLLEEHSK